MICVETKKKNYIFLGTLLEKKNYGKSFLEIFKKSNLTEKETEKKARADKELIITEFSDSKKEA